MPLPDQLLMPLQVLAHESMPRTVGKDVRSPYAQDLLRAGTQADTCSDHPDQTAAEYRNQLGCPIDIFVADR